VAILADLLKQRLQTIRGIQGTFGLRPNSVSVVTRTWASGRVGKGTFDDGVPLVLTPTPMVREVSTREVASSGGRFETGDLRVGPITPAYPGPPPGGYTTAQVAPEVTPDQKGVEVIYLVTGSDAGEYSRISLNSDFALHYTLTLRRSNRTP
jgi:hypothetical protein